MSAVRRHLPALAAVILAVALGIALGAGPLAAAGKEALESDQPAGGTPAARTGEGDAFAVAAAPRLYGQGLGGRSVALVSLPGADPSVVGALATEAERARGRSTRWSLEPSLTSTGEMALVDSLGRQLGKQVNVPARATAYERIGRLIARAVATPQDSDQPQDGRSKNVVASLAGADLMSGNARQARAPWVVVVLGDDVDDHILSGMLDGLRAGVHGLTVVAADRSGDLDVAAELPELSTVDGVQDAPGRVSALLAVLGSANPKTRGDFGASGSDGAFPLR